MIDDHEPNGLLGHELFDLFHLARSEQRPRLRLRDGDEPGVDHIEIDRLGKPLGFGETVLGRMKRRRTLGPGAASLERGRAQTREHRNEHQRPHCVRLCRSLILGTLLFRVMRCRI